MKYLVYEVWTKHRIIEADSQEDAYNKGEPFTPDHNMSLCNWHAVLLVDGHFLPETGALNAQTIS